MVLLCAASIKPMAGKANLTPLQDHRRIECQLCVARFLEGDLCLHIPEKTS